MVSAEKSSVVGAAERTAKGREAWIAPDVFKNYTHEYLFVFSAMLAQIFTQSATTNPLTLLNLLTEHFHASTDEQNWLMAAFPLASGAFVLISGRVGDVFGLKETVTGGYLWYLVWSLLAGISFYSNSKFYIVCRAFEGVGIAFVLPNMMGLLGSVYKPATHRKNMVFAMVGAAPPLGGSLGVIFAGLIATHSKRWDWAYYSLTIASAIGLALTLYSMPHGLPKNPNNTGMDWVGSAIGVVALVLFNFAWNEGPTKGWETAYIIVLLILGVVFFVAFWIWEIYFAQYPLIPHELSKGGVRLPLVLLSIFFGWGAFGVFIFYYFSFLQNLRHYSPVWAGGTMWAATVSGVGSAIVVGFLFRYVYVEVILVISLLGFVAPSIILAVTPVKQSWFANTMGALLIEGLGMDWSYPAGSIALSDALPHDFQGMAGSLVSTMTNYSMSIFLGFAATIERQINKSGKEVLRGYRAAFWFGVGLAGLGTFIALILLGMRLAFGAPKVNEEVTDAEEKEAETVAVTSSADTGQATPGPAKSLSTISPVSTVV